MVTVVLENKILAIFPIKWLKILIFVPIYIIIKKKKKKKKKSKFSYKISCDNLTQYFFIGDEFYKSTIRLQFFLISSMLAKFLKN